MFFTTALAVYGQTWSQWNGVDTPTPEGVFRTTISVCMGGLIMAFTMAPRLEIIVLTIAHAVVIFIQPSAQNISIGGFIQVYVMVSATSTP